MLDAISKAISTALFFLCTAIVTGLRPTAVQEAVPTAVQITEQTEAFSVVGEWQSGEKILKFTDSGKLICEDTVLSYTQNGDTITINGKLNEKQHEYTVKILPKSERVMTFNGITMYKIR